MPVGLRSRVPAKMTSSILIPRRLLADCSPSTHVMASEMFDLPQPLGPTMAAMPEPDSWTSVRSQNDLNPRIVTFLSLSMSIPIARLLHHTTQGQGDYLDSIGLIPANQPLKPHLMWIRSRESLHLVVATQSHLPCALYARGNRGPKSGIRL